MLAERLSPGQSDVDILVEVEPSIGLGFVTLAERLEQLPARGWTWFLAAPSNPPSGNASKPN
jgi:hypothetical protein